MDTRDLGLLLSLVGFLPIVPYFQHGGQVPLRDFLPSSSATLSPTPPVHIPEYPQVAIHSSQAPAGTPGAAPDTFPDRIIPTIDILSGSSLHAQSSEQASTPLTGVVDLSNGLDTQMKGKKTVTAAAATLFGFLSFSQIYQNFLFENLTPSDERADESTWVASSHSWIDRKACHWLGMCGLAHLNKAQWTTKTNARKKETANIGHDAKINLTDFWNEVQQLPDDWEQQGEREIPNYVIEHAPLIHLYSGEQYWPCDLAEHLIHTTPHLNYTPLQATNDHPNLTNLGELNRWGRYVYLQSDDNVEDRPDWLGGETNIPDVPESETHEDNEEADDPNWHYEKEADGEKSAWWHVGPGDTKDKGGIRPISTTSKLPTPTRTPEVDEPVGDDDHYWQSELRSRRRNWTGKKVVGGRSDAPAILIVVPKGDGVLDAFWFFFYSYNLGNAVFNVRFGNHVGDWEHTVVRFQNGVPKAVFFSEHSFGEAYTWEAIEKSGKRPIGFSATGTHAMYGTAGVHPYVLPGGILHDVTDRGPLWDPVQNMYSFTYHHQTDTLLSSNLNPTAPVSWFYFAGHWGDKFYPLSDSRQYRFLGQYHYVNGPLGPRFKNLGRQEICQGNGECVLKRRIGDERRRVKRWVGVGEGEEMSEDARGVWGPEYDSAS